MSEEFCCPQCGAKCIATAWHGGECTTCKLTYDWDETPDGEPRIEWNYNWQTRKPR